MKRTLAMILAMAALLCVTAGCTGVNGTSEMGDPSTTGTTRTPQTTGSTSTTTASTETATTTTQQGGSDVKTNPKDTPDGFNYMIGSQGISASYQFTSEDPVVEIGGRLKEMGANAIKFYATNDTQVDKLLEKHDYRYVFMWYRTDPYFKDGVYSDIEAELDYDAIYNYTKKLLTTYNGTGIEFFLGHWEGDWYFIDNYNTAQTTVSEGVTNGMIEWLNNRQKAVDDAKRDTPHENVYVWNYVEINRPTDAFNAKMDRVVNKVLPYTNVDYVSYSGYDSQDQSAEYIKNIIDYIYDHLPEKDGVIGPRVFVGEFAQPAMNQGFDDQRHAETNLKIFAKYLACDVRFVLYWQTYDNEKMENGQNRGFWLINSDNQETALYKALQSVLAKGRKYVTDYYQKNGKVPSHDAYRSYLLTLPEFTF